MISTTGRYGMKLLLMSSSCTGYPTSIDHPLEALIGSSFMGMLFHIEGSRWLIQPLFLDLLNFFGSDDKALQGGDGVGEWTWVEGVGKG